MFLKKFFLRIMPVLMLLGACSSNRGTAEITLYGNGKIEKEGAAFYVAKAAGDIKENNVSSLIKYAIEQYRVAYDGDNAETVPEAVASAKNAGAGYTVYPTVKRWDAINEPGRACQANIEFEIVIYETATGRRVSKTEFVRECIFPGPNFVTGDCVNLDQWTEKFIR